jgi:hypothetical protein
MPWKQAFRFRVLGLAHLDNKLEVALVVIKRRRGVRALDLLAVNHRLDRDVLADRQAE